MKRIIRLTESDLTRIVKRVLKEDENSSVEWEVKTFANDYSEKKEPVGGHLGFFGIERNQTKPITSITNDYGMGPKPPTKIWGSDSDFGVTYVVDNTKTSVNLKLYIKSKTGKSPSVLNKTVELEDIKGKDGFYNSIEIRLYNLPNNSTFKLVIDGDPTNIISFEKLEGEMSSDLYDKLN
jgi:hypothetical protein